MDEKKVIFLSSLKKIDALEEMVKALRERGLLSRSEGVFEDLRNGKSWGVPESEGPSLYPTAKARG